MTKQHETCPICDQIALWRSGKNPFFIHEFKNSIFVVGSHQFYKGYSLLLSKDHVREMHELKPSVQAGVFGELMIAARAIAETFRPWKMNYACYGNQAPHVHWHIIPRYESDPDRLLQPWAHSAEFDKHATDRETARELISPLREQLYLFLDGPAQ